MGLRDRGKEGGTGDGFAFDLAVITDLYIRFSQVKSQADLEGIVQNLDLSDNPILAELSAELPGGDDLGSIKFTIAKENLPEGTGVQEALIDIRNGLREKLEFLGINQADYSFDESVRNELHLDFEPKKSRTELEKLLAKLELYGGIPLKLRPIFPDNPLKQGLDLKGGLHIVLELDVDKAMDIYLEDQAKEVIFESLKSEKIFTKKEALSKTLEKRGDNTLIIRPYAEEGSESSQSQKIADMRKRLMDMGFKAEDIQDTSGETPELTVRMSEERSIGELVDTLLDGKNPIIVPVTIPQRLQDADRREYIDTARKSLDRLDLFDKPKLLSLKANQTVFSVQLSEESARNLAEDNLDTVMETLENRINKFGLAESTIRRVSGRPRILIEIPEEQNPARTLAAIKSPGILEFKLVAKNPNTGNVWYGPQGTTEPSPDELASGTEVRQHVDGGWYVLHSEAFMHGTDLKSNSATVRRDEYGSPEVIMFLTPEGQRKFTDFTGENVGEQTAILLDEVIQSAPRITEKISSRSARITGSFTLEEADYLAKILKAGAFPAPMRSAEERIVGPTLGQESINRGKLAFTIGISLVIVFMLIYYRWSGAISVIALLFNFQIILGILAGFGATLTLPGMAGLILTVGMSVDANVLILERIRDELRRGKTLRSSIDSGYQRAFWTILDANMTTLITAIVLYEFGTGPIKGFAVTLAIGIGASMFSALVFTREVYSWLYREKTINRVVKALIPKKA
jgi:preprotein translocase subunit SecD